MSAAILSVQTALLILVVILSVQRAIEAAPDTDFSERFRAEVAPCSAAELSQASFRRQVGGRTESDES